MKQKLKKTPPANQYLATIIATLGEDPGLQTGELAHALGLTTNKAKEVLTTLVKEGKIERKEVEEGGSTVFEFYNIAPATAAELEENEVDDLLASDDDKLTDELVKNAPEIKEPRKEAKRSRHPMTGRGNPDAKKAINPQQTLEAKKSIAKEFGGTMTWANRSWHIKTDKVDIIMTSKEIAGYTLEQFRRKLSG